MVHGGARNERKTSNSITTIKSTLGVFLTNIFNVKMISTQIQFRFMCSMGGKGNTFSLLVKGNWLRHFSCFAKLEKYFCLNEHCVKGPYFIQQISFLPAVKMNSKSFPSHKSATHEAAKHSSCVHDAALPLYFVILHRISMTNTRNKHYLHLPRNWAQLRPFPIMFFSHSTDFFPPEFTSTGKKKSRRTFFFFPFSWNGWAQTTRKRNTKKNRSWWRNCRVESHQSLLKLSFRRKVNWK